MYIYNKYCFWEAVCWSRSATCTHTPSHAALHQFAYLPDLSATCMRCVRTSTHSCTCRTCITTLPTLSYMHTYLYIPADSVSCTVVASHKHTCGHTSFSAAPHNTTQKPRTHAQRAPPYVAAWMSGPLAYIYMYIYIYIYIYIFSSDVCGFS